MDGDDEWLARAADLEIAGQRDFDANSFEDSERFDNDSEECDSGSLSEGMNCDWREAVLGQNEAVPQVFPFDPRRTRGRISGGSEHSSHTMQHSPSKSSSKNPTPLSELAARCCASHLAFYQLEATYSGINDLKRTKSFPYLKDIDHLPISDTLPDKFFFSIIFHCFPSTSHDIRLYSVLANGRPESYNGGELLCSNGLVTDVVQIGYLITAVVNDDMLNSSNAMFTKSQVYNVSIKVDRCRIIYCSCSCSTEPNGWCKHVVALALFRVKFPHSVQYRVTVWDAVNELSEFRLKKFAQYLINELPREYLPVAQKLLDQLRDPKSAINCSHGAPDPTDGGHDQVALFCFDEANIHQKIRKHLNVFCLPKAAVHLIDELGSHPTPSSVDFQRFLCPFVNLEPMALRNYLNMVRNMMVRRDYNATTLLRVITEECLANRLVILHWYMLKLTQNRWQVTFLTRDDHGSMARLVHSAQVCEEIVTLWRRVVLNPSISKQYREQLFAHLQRYHRIAAERVFAIIKSSSNDQNSLVGKLLSAMSNQNGDILTAANARFDFDSFPGFHSAMKVCVALPEVQIPGVKSAEHHGWLRWSDSVVPLLPEAQVPVSPVKKKTKSKRSRRHRRGGAGENSRHQRRRARREESSESGQESEQDEQSPIVFPSEDVASVLAESYSQMDPLDVRFAQCEAAASHGYAKQAATMALDLTKSLLSLTEGTSSYAYECAPSTSSEPQVFSSQRSRSKIRVEMLERSLYLATVLLNHTSDARNYSKAFSFVTKVLEVPKFPMATKYLQVKEHFLEMELVKVVQQLPIGEAELELLREAAAKIGDIVENGGIPPLALAKFVFEELSYSTNVYKIDHMGTQPTMRGGHVRRDTHGRRPEDDDIALGAALCALGAKLTVPDTEYPMLHEAMRSLKGQLTITLLCAFKDCREKLGLVLDRLLDPQVHLMYGRNCYTNASFLLREAVLQKRCLKGQRPLFPYHPKQKPNEDLQQSMENLNLGQPFDQSSLPAGLKKNTMKRWNIRSRVYSTATEALYVFMWDLAKRVLYAAGGSASSVFSTPATTTHRNLHICSLLISLYAVGLHNKVKASQCQTQTWKHRSYSSEVSWITQQITEIGASAYEIIREINWELHFTPSELATLSEKTMQAQIPQAPRESALLALAVLPMSHMMQANEAKSALQKCKDQGSDMLEQACDAVMLAIQAQQALDTSINTNFIQPDVLFLVARYWEELHKEKEAFAAGGQGGQAQPPPQQQQQPQQIMMPPPLHHMMSHPPPVHNNLQYMQHMGAPQMTPYQVPHSPPVYAPPPCFSNPPPSLMRQMLQAPPHEAANRLHQSHSAPQLSSGPQPPRPADGSSPSPRLVKAFRAGIAALKAMMRNQAETPRYTRLWPFSDDVEWLCEIALGLGEKMAFEFFEEACKTVMCPYTLVSLARKCYHLNWYCASQRITMPPQSSTRVLVSQMKTTPRIRQSCLETGFPFHPITLDIFERCIDQFYRAVSVRMNYPKFSESDRNEVEALLRKALEAFELIPHFPAAVDQFLHHLKGQKNCRREIGAFLGPFEEQLRRVHQAKYHQGYGNNYSMDSFSSVNFPS